MGIKLLNDPQLNALIASCSDFMASVAGRSHPRWLTILGRSGCGKTHCARFLWKTCVYGHDWTSAQFTHHMIHWPTLVQRNLRAHEYAEYEDMRRWPMLVLDDIGAERDNSGFATEHLSSMLNSRLGRWTIITSNLGLDEWELIDSRIPSRMIRGGSEVVQLTCQDFNTRTK